MKHYKFSEQQFCNLINDAASEYELFIPTETDEGFTWEKTSSLDVMIGSDIQPITSVKQFFFPNSETLFSFESEGREITLNNPPAVSPKVVLGVHPCDLGSLKVLETLFSDTIDDDLYRNRRKNTVIIGISCTKDDWACFCESLDINSQYSEAADLFITPGKDELTMTVTSELGEAFLERYAKKKTRDEEFTPPTEIKKTGKYQLDFPKIKAILDDSFNSPIWEKISRKCITCGICTYLCPTCHCFEIFDEARRGAGQRFRCYDACMYPHFTIMAGGYNPRPLKQARFRQRYMHKYNYFVDNFNLVACSGCGRCIRHCPVNVDVRENLTTFQNSTPKDNND